MMSSHEKEVSAHRLQKIRRLEALDSKRQESKEHLLAIWGTKEGHLKVKTFNQEAVPTPISIHVV